MISRDKVVQIGTIVKRRGIKGEVELVLSSFAEKDIANCLFLLLDGLLVPFFWEEYRYKNDTTLIIAFTDVEDETKAKRIVGADVYVERSQTDAPPTLIGYQIYDKEAGQLGTLVHIDDTTDNLLFYIEQENGKELLVPFHEDFFIEIDHEKKSCTLLLPNGLLHLNDK